jgi:parvulin-like peptidyl-prolyl isomerase
MTSTAMTSTTVAMRPIRTLLLSVALAFCPVLALAQTQPPTRPVQAPATKPKAAAPQVTAATQPGAAAPPAAQGQAAGPKVAGDDIVARVGGSNVSADELRAYVAALGANERAALAQDPAMLSQAVRMLLANRLVLQEIVAKKWDQQPNVSAQLDRVRENALVELYLQQASAPPANFPSDDDLQKVYDANRAAFLVPRQFELAQVFVALGKDADKAADDQSKKTVDDIQRKLKGPGADFAGIANDNGGKNGGDLGWVMETQIRPEIRAKVVELPKGAIADPIRLDDGWHIVKLIDTKASYTRTLPEVRDQLVQQIRNERATALRRAYIGELLKDHPPVLNELALSNLLQDQAPPAK